MQPFFFQCSFPKISLLIYVYKLFSVITIILYSKYNIIVQNTLKRHMFNKVLTNKFSVVGSTIKELAKEITLIEIARLERSKLIRIESR